MCMPVYLEKVSVKAQDMLRSMKNIRLAASRVCHIGRCKYDYLYRLKKECYPSYTWDTVDYELWVILVNILTGLGNSPDDPPNHRGSSGIMQFRV